MGAREDAKGAKSILSVCPRLDSCAQVWIPDPGFAQEAIRGRTEEGIHLGSFVPRDGSTPPPFHQQLNLLNHRGRILEVAKVNSRLSGRKESKKTCRQSWVSRRPWARG